MKTGRICCPFVHEINAYLPKFPMIGMTEPVALPDDELCWIFWSTGSLICGNAL